MVAVGIDTASEEQVVTVLASLRAGLDKIFVGGNGLLDNVYVTVCIKLDLDHTALAVVGHDVSEDTHSLDVKADVLSISPRDLVFKCIVVALYVLNDDLGDLFRRDLGENSHVFDVFGLLCSRDLHYLVHLVGVCKEGSLQGEVLGNITGHTEEANACQVKGASLFTVYVKADALDLTGKVFKCIKRNYVGMVISVGGN